MGQKGKARDSSRQQSRRGQAAHRGRRTPARALGSQAHIKDLTPDPQNARTHNPRNVGMIVDTMHAVGAARSIVIDEGGRILAGNAATEAAAEAGITKLRIIDTDGDELVAVRRRGLSDEQKLRLALADNRTAELATWNADVLASLRKHADLSMLFTGSELSKLLRSVSLTDGNTDPDDVPMLRRTSIRAGHAFALGMHVLVCGDSRNPRVVETACAKARPVLMNTDPPYGVDYAKVKDGIATRDRKSAFTRIRSEVGDIENDELSGEAFREFIETVIRVAVPKLAERPAVYLWHPMLTQGAFAAAAAAAADIVIHRQIVWVKPSMVLTRSGMYHWRHELCFYGWIRDKRPPWYGDKSQTSVWEMGRDGRNQHPTQKPVELFVRPIRNHVRAGEFVYEPFAGSGSQIIAAEQTGVRACAIEIVPRYCQQVIDRWEAFTGQKAEKIGDVSSQP